MQTCYDNFSSVYYSDRTGNDAYPGGQKIDRASVHFNIFRISSAIWERP